MIRLTSSSKLHQDWCKKSWKLWNLRSKTPSQDIWEFIRSTSTSNPKINSHKTVQDSSKNIEKIKSIVKFKLGKTISLDGAIPKPWMMKCVVFFACQLAMAIYSEKKQFWRNQASELKFKFSEPRLKSGRGQRFIKSKVPKDDSFYRKRK